MLSAELNEDDSDDDFVFAVTENPSENENDTTTDESTDPQKHEVTCSWIIDSAATRHLTNDKKLISNTKKLQTPIRVVVANGEKVKLSELGDIHLKPKKDNDDNETLTSSFKLSNVAYAPSFKSNLMSVAKIVDTGAEVLFKKNEAIVFKQNQQIFIAPRVGDLFILNQVTSTEQFIGSTIDDHTNQIWHYRMGHLAPDGLRKLKRNNAVVGAEKIILYESKNQVCEGCALGKAHRKPFTKSKYSKAESIMERVHSDLCGPIKTKYLCMFTDEHSHKIYGSIIQKKSDTADLTINWCKQATVETGKPLKEFHSDGGGEFLATKLLNYFKESGTKVTKTVKATPQHNGTAERANRTIIEKALCMLYHAKLPVLFWEEAFMCAIYIHNRCITSGDTTRTPDEIWSGKKPHINHLRVFGCDVYIHTLKKERSKLDPKSKKGIFVGYDESKQGYRVFDIELQKVIVSRDIIFNENEFTFGRNYDENENVNQAYDPSDLDELLDSVVSLPDNQDHKHNYEQTESRNDPLQQENLELELESNASTITLDYDNQLEDEEIIRSYPKSDTDDDDENGSETVSDEFKIPAKKESASNTARSHPPTNKRETKENKAFIKKVLQRIETLERKQNQNKTLAKSSRRTSRRLNQPLRNQFFHPKDFVMSVIETNDPLTYDNAISSEDAKEWKQAMDEEMEALLSNNTWKLVPLPSGRKAVGSKWVFKTKLNKDGMIERYKARFCAKGFSQKEGIDYHETFAPVLKYKSLRIVLAIVAIKDYELDQMDVQTAFLNATIKEEVYMKQPRGYEKGGESIVCKLNKTLYGTKQASHEWNEELNSFVITVCGFYRCKSDTCVYIKKTKSGNIIIILVFVDDIIISYASQDKFEWQEIKNKFMKKYKMKDMGACEWILGMRVNRDRENKLLYLDQEQYLNKILKQFDMENCTVFETPEELSKLSSSMDEPDESTVDLRLYQSIVGALLYGALSTRPDISHAVNIVSRYLGNPNQTHLNAAKRILKYIRGTTKLGLTYDGKSISDKSELISIQGYADADWAGDLDNRKSTTGYIILIGKCVVSWLSKKQSTVSLSSAEAEYMAISAATQEILWIRQLLNEITFIQNQPTLLYIDNQAAIAISENDTHHSRTKHIDIRHHFIRDAIKDNTVKVKWINSQNQLADILTKGLGKLRFNYLKQFIVPEQRLN
jgi:hypothetical protein